VAQAVFFGLPLHGHVNPSLALVGELVRRGDHVIYFAAAEFRSSVEATGAEYRAYRNRYLATMADAPVETDELTWLLTRTTGEILDVELDSIRAIAPDYVITDAVAPWGLWIGAILGRPVVASVTTFAFNRRVMAWAGRRGVRPRSAARFRSKLRHLTKSWLAMRGMRDRFGLRRPSVAEAMFGRGDLNVVYTSRSFQPCAETFGEDYLFVGPSVAGRLQTDDLPWEGVTRPVVYISLGTLFNRDVTFYRRCADAFGGQPVQVILSVGRHVAIESLGPWPPNFIVRPVVPQLDVLARASVFVSHGGMNSVFESLSLGVPLVIVPQMGEQEIVGRRVQELGAGLLVPPDQANAATLAAAVARLMTDESHRAAARVVGTGLRDGGGPPAAADAIAALLRVSPGHVDPGHVRSS
jgi:MGT family glycosyltransferase